VEFGGDVGADYVFYAYPCGLYFAGLSYVCHQQVYVKVAVSWLHCAGEMHRDEDNMGLRG
jgi:hypothetical protein